APGRGGPEPGPAADRPLLVPLVRAGGVVGREDLAVARERHFASKAELPASALRLSRGEPAIPTVYESYESYESEEEGR
ncbi:MAG: hypothetical protein ACRDPT_08760, partial [Streptomycetales bacterium]